MFRKFLFMIALVTLLSSGALACIGLTPAVTIGNTQGFGIDALNVVKRAGCVGSAEGSNIVMVGHAQEAYDVASGTGALQEETAILTQSGSAAGKGGKTAVIQKAQANGAQEQLVGLNGLGVGLTSQGQSLGVSLDQLTKNAKGMGGAVGAQGFVGAQSQMSFTPNSMSSQTQFIGTAQFSAIAGKNATVKNSLDVVLNQSQAVVEGGK
jgi:hypothetical protein